uniref:Uncharacterized protein n=1 Tax=Avena sativa TaxID=4498 RepID=A0ACD5YIW8_AVESA
MATKKHFFHFGAFEINDGSQIRFWEDKWLGQTSLSEQYTVLYSIIKHKGDTISIVMEDYPPNVSFRRSLIEPRLVSCNNLLLRLSTIQLSDGVDVFKWKLLESGKFSVGSLYRALVQPDILVDDNSKIWKMK